MLVHLALSMAEQRVLDTAALIAWPISELSGGLIVSHQEDELLRISPDRAALLESMGLVFCQPNQVQGRHEHPNAKQSVRKPQPVSDRVAAPTPTPSQRRALRTEN